MTWSRSAGATVLALAEGREPQLSPSAFLAAGAVVVGRVEAAANASIWYGASVRGDCGGFAVRLGERSNVQDNASIHVGLSHPVTVGAGVSIGHNAVLHGCEVQDDVLIGMGAIVLNGAVIGSGSLVAAGAVVLEGTEVPPRSMVAGVPGKVLRSTSDEDLAMIRRNADVYLELVRAHADARSV